MLNIFLILIFCKINFPYKSKKILNLATLNELENEKVGIFSSVYVHIFDWMCE